LHVADAELNMRSGHSQNSALIPCPIAVRLLQCL